MSDQFGNGSARSCDGICFYFYFSPCLGDCRSEFVTISWITLGMKWLSIQIVGYCTLVDFSQKMNVVIHNCTGSTPNNRLKVDFRSKFN